MKIMVASLFATLGLYVSVNEADTLMKTFVPQAEEAAAVYSLTAVGNAARVYALLEGETTIGGQFARVYAETPNREALTVDGATIRFDNGNSCWLLQDTPVDEPNRIEVC